MRKFIKLTKGRTGDVILIDVDIIKCVEQIKDRASETKTRVVTDREDWYVSEDYHTVMERLTALYDIDGPIVTRGCFTGTTE